MDIIHLNSIIEWESGKKNQYSRVSLIYLFYKKVITTITGSCHKIADKNMSFVAVQNCIQRYSVKKISFTL